MYPYSIRLAEINGHLIWIAKSTVLKGCVGQGSTADEAVQELRQNEIAWVDTAKKMEIPISDKMR